VAAVLLGVDVGGTFTDAVVVDGGRVVTAKVPSTPADQSEGVLTAVREVLARAGAEGSQVRAFAHGMTVATNALLEGKTARTVLVATEGFEDVVELGRQARSELYRLCAARPAPLVPPELRVGAPERCGPGGVLRALGAEDARDVAANVAELDPEAVAVCLLHGYAHPEHERQIKAALRERLGEAVHISLSHEVTATFREYERSATTEVDAGLSPLLARYLTRLRERSSAAGLPEPSVMQSSGGLTDAARAASHAALSVLSGPAGGAAAATLLAERLDEPNLLCFDMGGTSCDVCVVDGGRVRETETREVGGRPLALPMVDIHTVGAGGGSIAWRDPGGALRVGPRSAGADPGPACYGRGGVEPTVTDANLVLGRLPLEGDLSGVALDGAAALEAVRRLGDELGLEPGECADGIVRVANAEMVRALRVMTVERGVDPRDFVLLAFGGAGPLHAAAIADELGITRALAPAASGVLSALGLAAADRRADVQLTVLLRGDDVTSAELAEVERRLGDRAAAALSGSVAAIETTWLVRYAGQSHELPVRAPADAAELRWAFESEHEARYGYSDPAGTIEVITARVRAIEPGPAVGWQGERAGEEIAGPASVALPGATAWIPAGWTGRFDGTGTLALERAR
jgi:N-methylhydantoinase A/oxoprolinase/acetone carboxylase beta subunit